VFIAGIFRCSPRNLISKSTIGPFAPNIQSIGMVRNHVAIRAPSRVNRERAATEQVHSSIHCSIFRINSGIWLVLLVVLPLVIQRQIYFRRRDWYGTIGTVRLLWHQFTYCRQPGVDFPATSTLAVCLLGNQSSWLSSSLQHDHQSLPKVSSSVVFRGRMLLRRRDACLMVLAITYDRPARVFGCGERDSHTYYVAL
jgi:hypothetical protein